MLLIGSLLKDAKKTKLDDLNGVPVHVTFDESGRLKSWRVLTEAM